MDGMLSGPRRAKRGRTVKQVAFDPGARLDVTQVQDRRPGPFGKGIGANILKFEDGSYGFEPEPFLKRGQHGPPLVGPVPYFMKPKPQMP